MNSLHYNLNRLKFYYFQSRIHPQTWDNQRRMLQWAKLQLKKVKAIESDAAYKQNSNPVVKQGYELVKNLKKNFKNRYRNSTNLRILIHRPSSFLSPGGFSLFNNLAEGLSFLGVPVHQFWDEPLEPLLSQFKPNILLTSDSAEYLQKINWEVLKQYRLKQPLALGLTASIEEYGNTPVQHRLKWAAKHAVDFYYSFRSRGYLTTRKSYQPFFKSGYNIISVEFGANPLLYYPVPGIKKDLKYIFLASSNTDKWQQYFEYLPQIVYPYPGLIDGPGWFQAKSWSPPSLHRFLYARAKVGINLHISDSLDWPSELNERTYLLAACGVPQLIDNPLLLDKRFSKNSFFAASNPKEYLDLFHYMLEDTAEAQKRALRAQKQVFDKYTSFHRAEGFIKDLTKIIK